MGLELFTGTLLSVLLLVLPAVMGQSDQQLVDDSQPAFTVNYAVESTSPLFAQFAPAEMIQVRLLSFRVRKNEVREDEGNVQDGYILHFPAPT